MRRRVYADVASFYIARFRCANPVDESGSPHYISILVMRELSSFDTLAARKSGALPLVARARGCSQRIFAR